MTKCGFEFMQKWISEQIGSSTTSDSSDAFLTSTILRLRDDAAKEGIGWLEMADDPDDIRDAIRQAMRH